MKKSDRQKVQDKYDGKCALCGSFLTIGWHCWDIEPIQSVVDESGTIIKVNTELENIIPVCKKCGSMRRAYVNKKISLEDFRSQIAMTFNFLKDGCMGSSAYNAAIRFGLIEETGNPIIFYFEKINNV